MSESPQLPEDFTDSVFIYQVAITFIITAIPFLNRWLGGSFGNLAGVLLLLGAGRYCRSLRQEAEKRGSINPLLAQSYVVSLQKWFVWIRVGSFAVVALFLPHPYGLGYFLFFGSVAVADLAWESAKLGDLKAKESNQPPEAVAAGDRDSQ